MEIIVNCEDKSMPTIKDLLPGSCFYDQVTEKFYILSSTEWLAINLENGNIESYDGNEFIIPVKGRVTIEPED